MLLPASLVFLLEMVPILSRLEKCLVGPNATGSNSGHPKALAAVAAVAVVAKIPGLRLMPALLVATTNSIELPFDANSVPSKAKSSFHVPIASSGLLVRSSVRQIGVVPAWLVPVVLFPVDLQLCLLPLINWLIHLGAGFGIVFAKLCIVTAAGEEALPAGPDTNFSLSPIAASSRARSLLPAAEPLANAA